MLAADDAKIGFPAARPNGTPPTNLWFYHCGPQWAKRMLFTGDVISGLDAAKIGLVLDSYPAEDIDAQAAEMARRIGNVDAEILATYKRVVNMQMELAGARQSQCGRWRGGPARTPEDRQQAVFAAAFAGVKAFLRPMRQRW